MGRETDAGGGSVGTLESLPVKRRKLVRTEDASHLMPLSGKAQRFLWGLGAGLASRIHAGDASNYATDGAPFVTLINQRVKASLGEE